MPMIQKFSTKTMIAATAFALVAITAMGVTAAEARRAAPGTIQSQPLTQNYAYQILSQLAVYQQVSIAGFSNPGQAKALSRIHLTVADASVGGKYTFIGKNLTCKKVAQITGLPLPASIVCADA